MEPRKELTRFVWSQHLQKCWTCVTFGHFSWFSWIKTIIFFLYQRLLYKQENYAFTHHYYICRVLFDFCDFMNFPYFCINFVIYDVTFKTSYRLLSLLRYCPETSDNIMKVMLYIQLILLLPALITRNLFPCML